MSGLCSLCRPAHGTYPVDLQIIPLDRRFGLLLDPVRQIRKGKVGQAAAHRADQMIVPGGCIVSVWKSLQADAADLSLPCQLVQVVVDRGKHQRGVALFEPQIDLLGCQVPPVVEDKLLNALLVSCHRDFPFLN